MSRVVLRGTISGTLALAVVSLATAQAPAPSAWTYTTAFNPTNGTASAAAVDHKGFVYVAGGHINYTQLATVSYAAVGPQGTLGAWTSASSMTTARSSFGLVQSGGYLYAAGGPSAAQSVEYAKINTDGSLGPWQATSSMATGRYSFALAAGNGYLFAIGGQTPGAYAFSTTSSVEVAAIQADGSLGPWREVGSAPQSAGGQRALVHNSTLYVIGGWSCGGSRWCETGNGGGYQIGWVRYAATQTDGTLGPWQPAADLNVARSSFGLVLRNERLFVFGGGMPFSLSSVEYADIRADGGLSNWRVSEPLQVGRTNLAAAGSGTWLYAIAGVNLSTVLSSVEFADVVDVLGSTTLSFSPTSQTVGGVLTITGSGFNPNAARNQVQFAGNVTATATAATASTLTVTVPTGAISGPLSVSTNGVAGTPTSGRLTITPVVSSLTPSSQVIDGTIQIVGSGFDPTAANNTVNFGGGVTSTPTAATATSLTVTIPVGASSGPITVTTNGVPSVASQTALNITLPGCERANIQTKLNSGSTPLSIYNSCGQSLANLYGQIYMGGLIAYLNTTDGTGLVAAPSDYYINAFWTNMDLGYTTTGASGKAIGTGRENTATLISVMGAPTSQPGIQNGAYNYAGYVSQTTINGYSDWFLPSQDEMVQVMNNVIGTQGCVNPLGGYWTSTESNGRPFNYAIYIGCGGVANSALKNAAYSVRLVRAFPTIVPSATSFSPAAVSIGGTLTITGANFSTNSSANTVTFAGGVTATPTAATASTLTVTVPTGAISGPLSVSTNGAAGTPTSGRLTITPVVSSLTPSSQVIDGTIQIVGSGFDPTAANNAVVFAGGARVTASAATATSLSVKVPAGTVSGTVTVFTNGASSGASPTVFTVLPAIGGFAPTAGVSGTTLQITGNGFSAVAADNVVTFSGGATAAVTAATTTTLTIAVPTGATSGPLSVTTRGVVGPASYRVFTLQPWVDAFSPGTATVGQTVQLTGSGFSPTAASNVVTFRGGAQATSTKATATSLTVTVPVGALSGAVSVTSANVAGPPSPAVLNIAPTVATIAPLKASVFQQIQIGGTGFDPQASNNEVRFAGNVTARASAATATSLTVQVPAGAVSGPVSAITNRITGAASASTLTVGPYLATITPLEVFPGATVTLTGTGFGANLVDNQIYVSGDTKAIQPTTATTTQLTFKVPDAAVTGPLRVITDGLTSPRAPILGIRPLIRIIYPLAASIGDEIFIDGVRFDPVAENNVVIFGGGVWQQPRWSNAKEMVVLVPGTALDGPLQVVSAGVTSPPSATSLTVLPIVLILPIAEAPTPPEKIRRTCSIPGERTTFCPVLVYQGVSYWFFTDESNSGIIIVGFGPNDNVVSIQSGDKVGARGLRYVFSLSLDLASQTVQIGARTITGVERYVTVKWSNLK